MKSPQPSCPLLAPISLFLLAFLILPGQAESSPSKPGPAPTAISLTELIAAAQKSNPELQALRSRASAHRSRADAAGYWGDPTIGGNYFLEPIETRLGAQKGNLQITQPIPFPGKLSAKSEQLRQKSLASQHMAEDLRQKLILEIKGLFYQAYVVKRRLGFIKAEQEFLSNLAQVALAGVKVGRNAQQDVTLATLETTLLRETEQELASKLRSLQTSLLNTAHLDLSQKVAFPEKMTIDLSLITNDDGWRTLLAHAIKHHPKLMAARADMASADAGVQYAKRQALPDLKASVSWIQIEERNPPVDNGENKDAWAVGAGIAVPLWWGKYNAATEASLADKKTADFALAATIKQLESDLADLWQQAMTSKELITLYQKSVLPQAEQILSANQSAYQQGTVSFDRVITDFRRLLNLQIKLFKEEARFMTLIARLERASAKELASKEATP